MDQRSNLFFEIRFKHCWIFSTISISISDLRRIQLQIETNAAAMWARKKHIAHIVLFESESMWSMYILCTRIDTYIHRRENYSVLHSFSVHGGSKWTTTTTKTNPEKEKQNVIKLFRDSAVRSSRSDTAQHWMLPLHVHCPSLIHVPEVAEFHHVRADTHFVKKILFHTSRTQFIIFDRTNAHAPKKSARKVNDWP